MSGQIFVIRHKPTGRFWGNKGRLVWAQDATFYSKNKPSQWMIENQIIPNLNHHSDLKLEDFEVVECKWEESKSE